MERKVLYKNSEGYYDPTAGQALENMMKEDKTMNNVYYKGDILDAYTQEGSIGNPVMIVNADDNMEGGNVSVVYIEERAQVKNRFCVPVIARGEMYARCDRIFTIRKDRIQGLIRTATEKEYNAVNDALLLSLGIEPKTKEPIEKKDKEEQHKKENMEIMEEFIKATAQRDTYKQLYQELLERIVKGDK